MKRAVFLLFGLVFLCAAGQASADAINPAVEYASATSLGDPRPFTLGYEFTTSVTLDVNALAYYADGLGNSHQVGIWDTSGNLLASTTVLSTDPVVGHFQYDSIPILALSAGTYVIGGTYLGSNEPIPVQATGVVTIPGFTWVTDEQAQGSGLIFPTNSTGGSYGQNGILAVDFSVVPEPASFVLLSTAILAGAVLARLRHRKTALSA
jgi:hypothetical protein